MAKWKYRTGKVRGGYGEIDLEHKVIKIDKTRHRKSTVKRITPNKDGTENMLVTMAHELTHKNHPTWSEKKVEEHARKMKKTLSAKAKSKIYAKFS